MLVKCSFRSSEVEDEEYNEFYKSFSRDSEGPMTKVHFTAEGEVTFKSILFIPKTSPVDWQNQSKNKVTTQVFSTSTYRYTFNDCIALKRIDYNAILFMIAVKFVCVLAIYFGICCFTL